MNTKKILLAIIALAILGLIISYAMKSPGVNYENYDTNPTGDLENNIKFEFTDEDDLQGELAEVIDQEALINQELDNLESSF